MSVNSSWSCRSVTSVSNDLKRLICVYISMEKHSANHISFFCDIFNFKLARYVQKASH